MRKERGTQGGQAWRWGGAVIIPIVQERKTEAQRGNLIKSTLPLGRGARPRALATRAQTSNFHPRQAVPRGGQAHGRCLPSPAALPFLPV